MKLILFAFFALSAIGLRAADSFIPSSPSTNIQTDIYSKTAIFEHGTRRVIYHDNVIVDDPRIHITCEMLTAQLPPEGKRIDSIVAETNVVMLIPDKGATNRATSDKAVYTFTITAGVTNEVIELTGSPAIERPDGTLTGTKITWNRALDTVTADNQKMTYRGTNAPTKLVSTNAVSAPKTNIP